MEDLLQQSMKQDGATARFGALGGPFAAAATTCNNAYKVMRLQHTAPNMKHHSVHSCSINTQTQSHGTPLPLFRQPAVCLSLILQNTPEDSGKAGKPPSPVITAAYTPWTSGSG